MADKDETGLGMGAVEKCDHPNSTLSCCFNSRRHDKAAGGDKIVIKFRASSSQIFTRDTTSGMQNNLPKYYA
jgi:hypothetical protein